MFESNVKKNDRILVLKVKDNKAPKSSTGIVDSRLFTGDNELHAIYNADTNLWSMKYSSGGLPSNLKGSFTTFERLHDQAKNYFLTRNIEIEKVID